MAMFGPTKDTALPKINAANSLRFHEALRARSVVVRSLKVSAVVGTCLIAINQGDIVLAGEVPPIWKLVLTYCVPYSVSSYAAASAKIEQQKSLLDTAASND